jgi:hypothetical protein
MYDGGLKQDFGVDVEIPWDQSASKRVEESQSRRSINAPHTVTQTGSAVFAEP